MDKSIFVRRDGRVGTGAQRAAGVLVRVLSGRGCLGGPRPGSAGSWDPSAGRRHRGTAPRRRRHADLMTSSAEFK